MNNLSHTRVFLVTVNKSIQRQKKILAIGKELVLQKLSLYLINKFGPVDARISVIYVRNPPMGIL